MQSIAPGKFTSYSLIYYNDRTDSELIIPTKFYSINGSIYPPKLEIFNYRLLGSPLSFDINIPFTPRYFEIFYQINSNFVLKNYRYLCPFKPGSKEIKLMLLELLKIKNLEVIRYVGQSN